MIAQATQASAATSYHVLQYKYIPDILEKRGPFREEHLAAAGQKVNFYHLSLSHAPLLFFCSVLLPSENLVISQKDEGKLVLAGALADPVDSALFIWKDASREVMTALLPTDIPPCHDLLEAP